MSAYLTVATEFSDEACLVESLHQMGMVVEVNSIAATLIDYVGKPRPETAEVIVRRKNLLGAANDIGFKRQPDGKYKAIISENERRYHYGPAWMNRLNRTYAERRAMSLGKSKGMKFVKREIVKDSAGQNQVKLIFQVDASRR